jgi:hypothetical protein
VHRRAYPVQGSLQVSTRVNAASISADRFDSHSVTGSLTDGLQVREGRRDPAGRPAVEDGPDSGTLPRSSNRSLSHCCLPAATAERPANRLPDLVARQPMGFFGASNSAQHSPVDLVYAATPGLEPLK